MSTMKLLTTKLKSGAISTTPKLVLKETLNATFKLSAAAMVKTLEMLLTDTYRLLKQTTLYLQLSNRSPDGM